MTEKATELHRLTIYFNDGTRLDVAAPPRSDDAMTRLANLRNAMDVDKLMLEVDGQLLLVPLGNVKYIKISPAPPQLPDGVITGGILMT